MNTSKINHLPESIKCEIINTLTAFDSVFLMLKNNCIYSVSTGIGISDKYTDNVKIEIIRNTDIYSISEIQENIKNL